MKLSRVEKVFLEADTETEIGMLFALVVAFGMPIAIAIAIHGPI